MELKKLLATHNDVKWFSVLNVARQYPLFWGNLYYAVLSYCMIEALHFELLAKLNFVHVRSIIITFCRLFFNNKGSTIYM